MVVMRSMIIVRHMVGLVAIMIMVMQMSMMMAWMMVTTLLMIVVWITQLSKYDVHLIAVHLQKEVSWRNARQFPKLNESNYSKQISKSTL